MRVIVGSGLIAFGAAAAILIFLYAKLGDADSFMSFLRTPGTPLETYQRFGGKLRRVLSPVAVLSIVAGILTLVLVK